MKSHKEYIRQECLPFPLQITYTKEIPQTASDTMCCTYYKVLHTKKEGRTIHKRKKERKKLASTDCTMPICVTSSPNSGH